MIGSAAPDVVELYPGATARHARAALEAVLERMPFEVHAVSVEDGSEFMADFEVACRDRGIALFVLPPRSPKLERIGRARQPDPHRGVLRGHRRRARPRLARRGTARLGARLQHRPTPPSARLPHPGRVPGLARGRGVTEVPDEYSALTLSGPVGRLWPLPSGSNSVGRVLASQAPPPLPWPPPHDLPLAGLCPARGAILAVVAVP